MAHIFNPAIVAAIAILEEDDVPQQRNYHRENPFETLNEEQFRRLFRLNKRTTRDLITVLTPYIAPPTRESSLSILVKVLVALRFYAAGSYQLDVGSNYQFNLSQPSVSRCISEVTAALNEPNIVGQFVHFPANMEELNQIKQRFLQKYNFPGVIGCIDCTHVAIAAPNTADEHIYVNRNNYHSMNVQLICDDNMKILNANARYPGRTHDSFIWQNSNISRVLEQLYRDGQRNNFLLGDSGYPLRPWLITPVNGDPALHTPEAVFNGQHSRTRCIIERCNGLLKARFRCLLRHRALHYNPQKASQIIMACVVLHNVCVINGIEEPDDDEFVDDKVNDDDLPQNDEDGGRAVEADLQGGRAIRQTLINHFNNNN